MTITDKLNEIEERTRGLAIEAQTLEAQKKAYEGLLECSIHDHEWQLGEGGKDGVVSSLREVQFIHIQCKRCHCYALFRTPIIFDKAIEIETPSGQLVKDLLPEEDE